MEVYGGLERSLVGFNEVFVEVSYFIGGSYFDVKEGVGVSEMGLGELGNFGG